MKKLFKKIGTYNFFIFIIFSFLLFTSFYFFYHRYKKTTNVYAAILLIQSRNSVLYSTTSPMWLPYWYADSIAVGDKDVSSLGGVNAQVISKEAYGTFTYGKNIYLVLKMNAVKDRSGVYLYKNKPLLVGSVMNLNLNKVQTDATIIYVGSKLPVYPKRKIRINIKSLQSYSWEAQEVKVSDTIIGPDSQIIARIISKKDLPTIPLSVNYESNTDEFIYTSDTERQNFEIVVDLEAEEIGDSYYFEKTQNLKIGNYINLPFNNLTVIGQISSIKLDK